MKAGKFRDMVGNLKKLQEVSKEMGGNINKKLWEISKKKNWGEIINKKWRENFKVWWEILIK